jgi:murein L,D-transpeptidase YcbB/YkuD
LPSVVRPDAASRTLSAGCVRLENAMALAQDVLGGLPAGLDQLGPEARVDLPRPGPVHIGYFTLDLEADAPAPVADVYGRDAVGKAA